MEATDIYILLPTKINLNRTESRSNERNEAKNTHIHSNEQRESQNIEVARHEKEKRHLNIRFLFSVLETPNRSIQIATRSIHHRQSWMDKLIYILTFRVNVATRRTKMKAYFEMCAENGEKKST